MRNRLALAALAALLLAPAPRLARSTDLAPREYLDQETAATVTVVAEPLVFAYARTELAANARDYVTLAAAAVNRGGKVDFVGIAYFWSTVDPRMRTDPLPTPEPLIIQADDRRIELKLRGQSAHDAGIGVPAHAPPGPPVTPNVYGIDLPTLRFIAAARHLTLLADSRGTLLSYRLWGDQRAALQAFVRRMSGED
ncbi:MAG TPA: hypothetical protein VKT54_14010 [Steroidobacteraceae bacterium]|nr:hypothetical protein [Steroidobacteraceae bacterium]